MKKFKVGQRVVLRNSALEEYNDDGSYTQEGIVQEIHKSGKCLVKWDKGWDKGWEKGNTAGVEPDDLVSEEEAEKILDTLEKEYDAWANPIKNKMKQIKNKMKQAAKLLQEADELTAKQDKNLTDMHNCLNNIDILLFHYRKPWKI